MKSANIITCRRYEDGSINVTVNGREIPDCTVCQLDIANDKVYLVVQVGQYNDLKGDEGRNAQPEPKPDDIFEITWKEGNAPPPMTSRQEPYFVLTEEPAKPAWFERVMRWWNGG